MCTCQAVGPKGTAPNRRDDVRLVQMLLNGNLGLLTPLRPLSEDGQIGSATITALTEFQRRIVHLSIPPGSVSPGDVTWKKLQEGLGIGLTREKFRIIMFPAGHELIQKYFAPVLAACNQNAINTPLRQAHFFGQIGHESGNLKYSEEIASGAAYEGRADLGNTQAGDGVRFKGRGLIQITGRANYTAYGTARGQDYTTEPNNKQLATIATVAADCSGWYWAANGLNTLADSDDIRGVTKRINGGFNGLDDRTSRTNRAKCVLL